MRSLHDEATSASPIPPAESRPTLEQAAAAFATKLAAMDRAEEREHTAREAVEEAVASRIRAFRDAMLARLVLEAVAAGKPLPTNGLSVMDIDALRAEREQRRVKEMAHYAGEWTPEQRREFRERAYLSEVKKIALVQSERNADAFSRMDEIAGEMRPHRRNDAPFPGGHASDAFDQDDGA